MIRRRAQRRKAKQFPGRSAYHLTLQHIVVNDPDPERAAAGWRVDSGEQVTEGYEADVFVTVTRNWQFNFGGAKIDVTTPNGVFPRGSTQEADAFPGKHAGLKDSIEHGDSTSAMAWSYDIADETQHVRFGAKWIPIMIEKTGEPRSYEQLKNDACNWRVSVLAEVYRPAAATPR